MIQHFRIYNFEVLFLLYVLRGFLCFNSMQLDRNTLPKKGLRYTMFYSAWLLFLCCSVTFFYNISSFSCHCVSCFSCETTNIKSIYNKNPPFLMFFHFHLFLALCPIGINSSKTFPLIQIGVIIFPPRKNMLVNELQ